MRLDIETEDRPGITGELLTVLAGQGFDVSFVEVEKHHVYLDAPALEPAALPGVRAALQGVPGFRAVAPIDLMPRERRRRELEAALGALPDPVFIVDGDGVVRRINRAAARAADTDEAALVGRSLNAVIALEDARALLTGTPATVPEVTFAGQSYLPEVVPLRAAGDETPDGMLVQLKPPARLGQMVAATQRGSASATGLAALVGDSAPMQDLRRRAARLAGVDAPVLIRGDTGTGKELLARALHNESARAEMPFMALNCAAIPESLAESELFGYEAGAFSGAARGGKPGLAELADGGTIFLDEIGELAAYLQAKLLRFVQDGSFRRIGGGRERRVSVRIIAATHRDLAARVADGLFREDLLYRLNVLTLEAPPLRARPEDIPVLTAFFVERAAQQIGRPVPAIAPDVHTACAAHGWPGNVRELENRLFRAVSLLDGDTLRAADLDLGAPPEAGAPAAEPQESLAEAAAMGERALLSRLYPHYPSTRALAQRLGVSHTTVAQKLKRYGLRPREA